MASHADDMLEIYGARVLQQFCGVEVTYQRGDDELTDVPAVAEDIEYAIAGDDGREVKKRFRDYVIKAGDLTLSGNLFEPRSGDVIQETIGGTVRTFEAVRRGDKPAVELLPGGYRWVIHTMQVDE